MAKYHYAFDEQKLEKWLSEGRGKGRLDKYKPWLTVHDVPSSGLSQRLVGRKSGRLHHVLSDGEANAFLEFDWDDDVLDIREQYPLDRNLTRPVAGEMSVTHPRDQNTSTDIVMTTDFMLDLKAGDETKCVAW